MSKSVLNLPVLVLNANYEPLNVCNTKRAISLLFADKADLVINGRGKIQTRSATFDLPSVIRLRYMIKRPRPRITLSKREILRRDNYTCQYCGRSNGPMTIDHVVPRRLAGAHSWENLVTACADCNRRKGGQLLERCKLTLRRRPYMPTASAKYRFGTYLERHSEWEPFVDGW